MQGEGEQFEEDLSVMTYKRKERLSRQVRGHDVVGRLERRDVVEVEGNLSLCRGSGKPNSHQRTTG